MPSQSEYLSTWILGELRNREFSRLERTGETYVDYMGGSLYPESLVKAQVDFLATSVLGNTHSISNRCDSRFLFSNGDRGLNYVTFFSSKLSMDYANEARRAVLSFFKAPKGFTVIFTANASGALKLVGESYPFTQGSNYVLAEDCHNSVTRATLFFGSR